MNRPVVATYYDGKSSSPQQVNIIFYDTSGDLIIEDSNNNNHSWRAEDTFFEQYGSLIEIRNKKYAGALLKIDDLEFSNYFYQAMRQNKRVDVHTRLLKLGFTKIIGIAIGLLALMVIVYFYFLPIIAEKSVSVLPESFDNEIGSIFMDSFLKENAIDSTKTKYLENFATEINLKNNKPLQFMVVDSKEVNAFAVPNGQIVVFTGILDEMKKPEELAALMGHEATHVNRRHSIKTLSRNLAGYIVVSLIFSDVNGIMAVLADNANQINALSFSRKFEQEADEQGLKILIDNHLNPKGMVHLFERLKTENEISSLEVLSTHPLTKERIKNIDQLISKTDYEIKPHKKLEILFKKIKNE